MKVGFAILYALALLAGCNQTRPQAVPKESATPLESLSALHSWPRKPLTMALSFRQPLSLEQARNVLSSFGEVFYAGFFVIGEGGGAFRTRTAVSINKVRAEVLRVAKHLAYVKPRHDCEIAIRFIRKYGLESYSHDKALKIFMHDQRLQNIARSIVASENTRKYALGVIKGDMPTLYAVILRTEPDHVVLHLDSLVEGVAHVQGNGGVARFHPPKPTAVKNIVSQTKDSNYTSPEALFNEAIGIVQNKCKIKLFQ